MGIETLSRLLQQVNFSQHEESTNFNIAIRQHAQALQHAVSQPNRCGTWPNKSLQTFHVLQRRQENVSVASGDAKEKGESNTGTSRPSAGVPVDARHRCQGQFQGVRSIAGVALCGQRNVKLMGKR